MRKQDEIEIAWRYGTWEIPFILPKMQTGNSYKCPTNEYVCYQGARGKDAEPINLWNEITVFGSVFAYADSQDFSFYCLLLQYIESLRYTEYR